MAGGTEDRRRGIDMRPTLEDETNAAWGEVNKARSRAEVAEARVGELTAALREAREHIVDQPAGAVALRRRRVVVDRIDAALSAAGEVGEGR